RNASGEKRKTPGCFSSAQKGGGVEQDRTPHKCRSRNPPLGDPPQFFGQIFWEKILEIKIVSLASRKRGRYASSRSDSAAIGQWFWHRWSISRTTIEPKRKRRSARFRTIQVCPQGPAFGGRLLRRRSCVRFATQEDPHMIGQALDKQRG